MTYEGVRALVLGATGFVGRHVARALFDAGASLTSTGRDGAALGAIASAYGLGGERIVLDATSPGELERVIARVAPGIVFNAIGYGVDRRERDEALAARINGELVPSLAAIVDRHRDRSWAHVALVHIGSALEYGDIGGDLVESSDPRPTTLYGRTKLEGTLGLRAYAERAGLPALTARLFTVYGPGEHPGRLLPSLLAVKDTPLDLTSGTQKRDFTYVGDVAAALLAIGKSDAIPGEVVNVATGRLETVRAFVETAMAVLSIPPHLVRFGALPQRAEEMTHDPVRIDRLRQLTGRAPVMTPTEGIRATVSSPSIGASPRSHLGAFEHR